MGRSPASAGHAERRRQHHAPAIGAVNCLTPNLHRDGCRLPRPAARQQAEKLWRIGMGGGWRRAHRVPRRPSTLRDQAGAAVGGPPVGLAASASRAARPNGARGAGYALPAVELTYAAPFLTTW